MVGAWGRGLRSGYAVCRVIAVVPPHAYSSQLSCSDIRERFLCGVSPMTAGCTRKRVLTRMFVFQSKRRMRLLRMAIAVLSGRVYGMRMVRGDVFLAKIGAGGTCWFR